MLIYFLTWSTCITEMLNCNVCSWNWSCSTESVATLTSSDVNVIGHLFSLYSQHFWLQFFFNQYMLPLCPQVNNVTVVYVLLLLNHSGLCQINHINGMKIYGQHQIIEYAPPACKLTLRYYAANLYVRNKKSEPSNIKLKTFLYTVYPASILYWYSIIILYNDDRKFS